MVVKAGVLGLHLSAPSVIVTFGLVKNSVISSASQASTGSVEAYPRNDTEFDTAFHFPMIATAGATAGSEPFLQEEIEATNTSRTKSVCVILFILICLLKFIT